MTKKEKAKKIIEILEEIYPDAICSLEYSEPYQLLIATRLAAQCTDARVNMVTPALFDRFSSVEEFAAGDISEIEQLVRSCGFYKTKAKDIKAACQMMLSEFDGKVPDNMDDLLKLPGVGRKTANLIVGDIFGKPAIVCDTHCIRITNLLGLAKGKVPEKVEDQLRKILPPEKSNDFCHRLVLFGRDTCIARRPKCDNCRLRELCASAPK